jgi:hypothetical protein
VRGLSKSAEQHTITIQDVQMYCMSRAISAPVASVCNTRFGMIGAPFAILDVPYLICDPTCDFEVCNKCAMRIVLVWGVWWPRVLR